MNDERNLRIMEGFPVWVRGRFLPVPGGPQKKGTEKGVWGSRLGKVEQRLIEE
jgi:hypothetical protein